MNTAEVIYLGSLRVRSVHLQSGTETISDAPTDNHGKGAAFSPTDNLAASLASCMLITLAIKAQGRMDIGHPKATVQKVMANNPRRVKEIHVEIAFDKYFQEKDRAFIEEVFHSCPVALSLHPDLKQVIRILYPDQP